MLKLYYSPGACSLSPHIALQEAGLAFETEKVDLRTKQTKSGADFKAINPKGYVPALQLDNGEVLTEGPAIVQYIADQKPASGLAPAAGTPARYRLMEMLNYISTELHKSFGTLFNGKAPDEYKSAVKEALSARLQELAKQLSGGGFLMGEHFTVADGYLFTVLGWTRYVHMDLAQWPALKDYADRIAARPAVQAAMKAEGLLK